MTMIMIYLHNSNFHIISAIIVMEKWLGDSLGKCNHSTAEITLEKLTKSELCITINALAVVEYEME